MMLDLLVLPFLIVLILFLFSERVLIPVERRSIRSGGSTEHRTHHHASSHPEPTVFSS